MSTNANAIIANITGIIKTSKYANKVVPVTVQTTLINEAGTLPANPLANSIVFKQIANLTSIPANVGQGVDGILINWFPGDECNLGATACNPTLIANDINYTNARLNPYIANTVVPSSYTLADENSNTLLYYDRLHGNIEQTI